MLKKMILAAVIAGTTMMAVAGGASAAGTTPTVSAPAKHLNGKAASKSFKIAGKRHFKHGRHFHYWNDWHYRPGYSCYWLKRKARWTGKGYWWKRYYACRYHNYY